MPQSEKAGETKPPTTTVPRRSQQDSATDWSPGTPTTTTTTQQPDESEIREIYSRARFLRDLDRVSQVITDQISNDPNEVAKLRRSIQQAERGQRRPYRKLRDEKSN